MRSRSVILRFVCFEHYSVVVEGFVASSSSRVLKNYRQSVKCSKKFQASAFFEIISHPYTHHEIKPLGEQWATPTIFRDLRSGCASYYYISLCIQWQQREDFNWLLWKARGFSKICSSLKILIRYEEESS